MKQTAVEWLIEQIDNQDMGEIPMWIYDFCEQAKAMEKEQIIDAHQNVLFDEDGNLLTAEQYYNETFKQDWWK